MKPQHAIVFVFLLALAGCSTAPVKQYFAASETFTSTVDGLVAMRAAGQISDEDWPKIKATAKQVNTLLDQWDQALLQGRDFPHRDEVLDLIRGLTRIYVEQQP